MTDGEKMLALAVQHIGEAYRNVCVPKNNPHWRGPWDCAEFISWIVYQTGQQLYGCIDNNGNPALIESYTGAWQHDAQARGTLVSLEVAASTKGGILLRYPPYSRYMGHIVLCDGEGGTIEAMGQRYGVCRGKVANRVWDAGVLIPGFTYLPATMTVPVPQPLIIYAYGKDGQNPGVIKAIQAALKAEGFDPGPIDGTFNDLTLAAIQAYQTAKGLVVDGQVGPKTARSLKVRLS